MATVTMKLARSPFLLAAALALSAWCARAQAEPAAANDLVLTDEASLVRFALAHNLDLRAVRWEQDIASAGVSSAAALSNPVARAEWLHVQSPSDYGWGVGLAWAPPQPGVYGAGEDAARARVRAVKGDFSERAADLEAAVRRSYAQVGALEAEIALAEKSVDTRRSVHQAVKERVAHGAASRIDLSLAAVSLARGEQERDLLVLGRASELAELEALLGLPADRRLDLSASAIPKDAPEAAATNAANLEQRAVARRPQLQADAARADAAEATLAAERAKRWPWLELQVRYRRHDQSTYPDDVTLGVELTLPIFNQNPGPIAAAEASRRELRDVALAHRASIERDVRALRAESERRREIAEHYASTIAPVLSEHAALVKQALAGMELDLTALLAAEDLVTKGGIEYLEARLAQRRAEIALARALGEYGRAAGAK
jgi:cobalt-zinc-cadmium efflux system outer membrane protein